MGHNEPLRAQLTRSSTLDTAYSTLLAVGTGVPLKSSSTPSNLFNAEVVEDWLAMLRLQTTLAADEGMRVLSVDDNILNTLLPKWTAMQELEVVAGVRCCYCR
mmetsp:Transcript_21794/g.27496  ORF Transcript_21794/g.27496 Transcript_21794/m.27496 type:complete len:103 (-) Transcript_21794:10-318(-)